MILYVFGTALLARTYSVRHSSHTRTNRMQCSSFVSTWKLLQPVTVTLYCIGIHTHCHRNRKDISLSSLCGRTSCFISSSVQKCVIMIGTVVDSYTLSVNHCNVVIAARTTNAPSRISSATACALSVFTRHTKYNIVPINLHRRPSSRIYHPPTSRHILLLLLPLHPHLSR